jgi:hypothetical protein
MDNPEKQATLGTRHRTKTTTKEKRNKNNSEKMSDTDLPKKTGRA